MQSEAPPPVRIEAANEWAWCGERRLELTPRTFAVLRHLIDHAERLVTKDELFATVWRDTVVSEAALSSCIRDLRKALRDSSRTPRYIQTEHRRGFRFIGPIATSGRERSASVRPSSVAPLLVGREAELARLHARLTSAMSGQRRLVFATGEPGIGKTALVEAFLAHVAGRDGVRVGRGQCVEQYGAGEAYLPVLEALGRLGREPDGDALVHTLARHAPTWLAQLPGLLTDDALESTRRRAHGASRDRMLRELVEALDVFTRDAPLVLLLEDLHWSDSATIDLLAMLARRRDAARLLVIGTYRPAEVGAAAHPVRAMKQELQLHGLCEEMPLGFLDAPIVGRYLDGRFAAHRFPPELAGVLHRHTDGNPLFLVNTVDDLVAQGQLQKVDGRWALTAPPDEIALGAPRTLGQMVERQVERLTPEERAMLAVASVAGTEFSAAVASAAGIDVHEGDRRCEALARRGQFLRATGVAEWPDGTVAGRYAFIHALYQSALYAGVPVGQRVGLHLRIGGRLERGYGGRAGEIAGELAVHFERGRDVERAIAHRRQAGENAARHHGYREAAAHATKALELLRTLPDAEARSEQELSLQIMLGAALTTTRGYAAPEVGRTYARARELCARLGDTPELLPALHGLARFYFVQGALETAKTLTRQFLVMAPASPDSAPLLSAYTASGIVEFYRGELASARDHLERGIALYDADAHSPYRSRAFRVDQDPGVSCMAHSALTLWTLGYPARAAARAEQTLTLARSLQHPLSLVYANHFLAVLHQCRGDLETMQTLEDDVFAQATEHGLNFFLASGAIQRGWLLARRGHVDEGLAQMQLAIDASRKFGADLRIPAFLASMAEVYEQSGRPAEGLSVVSEAFTVAEQFGAHYYWTAELHRLKGALMRPSDEKAAEECFHDAIGIARRQGAKSLELRATMSLSRLWAGQGKTSEARTVLADVSAWFSEGFDTSDLAEANALLAELRS